MRFVSIKILVACILIPPVLYLLTAAILEHELDARFTREIEEISVGDPQPLLDGGLRLRDALSVNINDYLSSSFLVRNGFAVHVTVATRSGRVLYPAPYETPEAGSGEHSDSMRVAMENFALLNDGLKFRVEVRLEHNRLFSNLILGVYILAALAVLFLHYRNAGIRMRREEQEQQGELDRLVQLERLNTDRLSELHHEREKLQSALQGLKVALTGERERAERNEDELIGEIESLEKKLAENLELQQSQQQEIRDLKGKIAVFEEEQQREDKGRLKMSAAVQKRFATLYKSLLIHERAVKGFLELNEELRLKAEEVIHLLNSDPDLVAIKRKVFGKKNRETVFEVVFAYKGRLYFRKRDDRRTEILAIGTKNSQSRELEFLANL